MMMQAAGPGGGVLHGLTLSENRNKLPKWVWGLVAVSVVFHGGVGVWLYQQKFVAPPVAPPGDIILDGPMYKWPKPDVPPRTPQTPPRNVINPHIPPITTPLAPLDNPIIPVDTTPTKGVGVITTIPEIKGTAVSETPAQTPAAAVIGNPRWLSRPNAEQMARYYPTRALAEGVEGRAVIRCRVTAAGEMTACSTVSEAPAGYRFGDAGQKLSRYFKISPRTVDGKPVEGAEVDIPIGFKLN